MLIKDLENGTVRKYGTNCHDSLAISQDGRTLSYYNLQCGEGSEYGCYRFVMEDGEVPSESYTPDAVNGCAYFNIGGWKEPIEVDDDYIRGRESAFDDALICLNGARMKAFLTLANSGKSELDCAYDNVAGYIDMVIERLNELKEQKNDKG